MPLEGAEGPPRAARGVRASRARGPSISPVLTPFVLASLFMKVPPNKAVLVRSKRGDRKVLRVVLGGSATINPLTEEAELLETGVRRLDHVFEGVRTADGQAGPPIDVRASLNVTILTARGLTPERAELLLKLPTETFNAMVVEAVSKRLREACASCTAEDLHINSEMVAGWVLRAAAADLEPVGVDLRSFAIRELEDTTGYLDAVRNDMMDEYLEDLERQRAGATGGPDMRSRPPAGARVVHSSTYTRRYRLDERLDGEGQDPAPAAGQEWLCPGCLRPFTPEERRALPACPRCGRELQGKREAEGVDKGKGETQGGAQGETQGGAQGETQGGAHGVSGSTAETRGEDLK